MSVDAALAGSTAARIGRFRWSYLLYVLAFAPFVLVMWFVTARPVVVLPRMQVAPGFMLTDQFGEQVDSEDTRGRVLLVNMTYANCQPPACNDTTLGSRALFQRLDEVALGERKIGFLTISLDPARDDVAALQALSVRHDLPTNATSADAQVTWHVATNPSERVLKTIVGGGYSVWYEAGTPDAAGDYMIDFKRRWLLVDGWGVIRSAYEGDVLDVDLVIRDLNYLMDEIERSSGPAAYAYEAAHLFRCYP